jgi:hypothetical protein
MANVYSIAFSVLGVVVAHCLLLVWTALILPAPVERARRRIETRPIFSFLIGLVCCLVTIGLIAGFSAIRTRIVPRIDDALEYLSVHLQFTRSYNDAWILTNGLVWFLAAPVLAGLIFGGAGFAQLFGIRARAMMRDDRPLLGLTYGALCTSASYFVPLVGWFIFLPIVGLISIGAGICGILGRSATRGAEARAATVRRQESIMSSP